MTKIAPAQRPATSKQTYGTPVDFLAAVQRRFGEITVDAAADACNHVVDTWMGPGSPWPDALVVPWAAHSGRSSTGLFWVNPPFGMLAAFAEKCAAEGALGVRVAMLSPASIGTEWFAAHVHHKALVLGLRPRLTFVGEKDPYPKDLCLSVYGPFIAPGFDVWKWNA